MKKPGLGVVIGRFQVPELHRGHHYIIGHAFSHQKTLVMIGCHSGGVSTMHPLDYATRERMIKDVYPEAMVCPIMDQPTNEQWSTLVDQAINIYAPFASQVTLYAGRDSFAPLYTGKHNIVEVEPVDNNDSVSGTDLREAIGETALDSRDFRCGVIYCSRNMWYPIKSTVDIAMIREVVPDIQSSLPVKRGEYQVLLVQKPSQPDMWRFPGGFMDLKDDTRELCARRELAEETGLYGEDWHHVGDFRVGDWRDTIDDAIQTDLFVTHYTWGKETPGDDIKGGKAQWFSLYAVENSVKFADDHARLAKAVVDWVKTNKALPKKADESSWVTNPSKETM